MRIEQMLHGYDNGHRLLAGSIMLNDKADMEALATLSDWSEHVLPNGDSSYLTAYPLKESGYYVVAKTWYAEEMKRPGCVWTHSLLIPFEELNIVDDFRRISTLFIRPAINDNFDLYSRTIIHETKFNSPSNYKDLTTSKRMIAMILLSFLNSGNMPLTFGALKDNDLAGILMLSVMNMVPMAMLQNVSWCTGTAYPRKINGKQLTCQFLSRQSEDQILNTLVKEEKWIDYVTDAMTRGDVNKGQLIRMFAEDIGESMDKYSAIVKVLYTLEDYFNTEVDSTERYRTVFEIIASYFPTKDEGLVIKKLCTNKIFSERYCSELMFFYFLATLPLDGVFNFEETKVEERWKGFIGNNKEEYVTLLKHICESGNVNEWGAGILKESATVLTMTDVTEIIKSDYQLFSSITLLNPEILEKVQWQVLPQKEIESILPMILDSRTRDSFTQWATLFATMLEQGVEISNEMAVEIFAKTNDATTILLDFVNKDSERFVNMVLGKQIERRQKEILAWLGGVETVTVNVAYAIVNSLNERSEDVVNAGSKVWKPFLGLQYQSLRVEVYAFLFSLSFNWLSDRDALELMRMAFYPLHTLEEAGKLGYGNWMHIACYMESLRFWEEWDKCKKMRKTVVKRLKNAGYDKSILNHYTPNSELNEMMIKMW